MSKLEGGLLEGQPLADGAPLELLVPGGRWLPVRWYDGGLVVELGGDWEQQPDGEPPACRLHDVDLTRAELRRAEPPARAARVVALSKWLESQAPGVTPETPVDLDLLRAHKQFAVELPRVIEEYQQKLRHHSFDLFHAASNFGAGRVRQAGEEELATLSSQLEAAALQFEETSRWLSAFQVMQADES
jgi:hypothetical protein